MTLFEILVCIILVAISGFMSASEIALFSLSRFQLRSLKERHRSSHHKIKRLLSDPAGLLIIILVINEVINVALSTIVTQAISEAWITHALATTIFFKFPEWTVHSFLGILVVSPIVLFLCEITPKVIAARANLVIAPLTVHPLSLIYNLLKPVRVLLQRFVTTVSQLLTKKVTKIESTEEPPPLLKEEDFLNLVEEGQKEGAIRQNEVDLIRNVFELDDTSVDDVQTPIARVYTLPAHTTLDAALNAMKAVQYSRIPVTQNRPNGRPHIVGILYSKDLLVAKLEKADMNAPISSLMEKPLFIPPTSRLNSLFRRMKNQKVHMAVVENPPGNVLGIVTMTDILDALFEEIM